MLLSHLVYCISFRLFINISSFLFLVFFGEGVVSLLCFFSFSNIFMFLFFLFFFEFLFCFFFAFSTNVLS